VSVQPSLPPPDSPDEPQSTATVRLGALYQSGGLITALITTLLAFLIGGLVVLVTTGSNPLETYKAIFDGTGLNWLFPWEEGEERVRAARRLQATLLLTTSLILTGLAVAFAFRCGLFNIGGQGQYMLGAIAGVWIGTSLPGLPGVAHILLALAMGVLAGALLAGIAGILKATVGAHEVIVTIMLNWIVYWFGTFLFGLQGPLQNTQEFGQSNPVSDDIAQSAHLPVFWGNPILQGLHIGFFIAIGALVFYWVILNRTTLGYEVRAVGFSPEAARYGGISVARNYFLAMAISGGFAGLAGAIDILGWQFRLAVNDVQISTIGFIGIAVALLGRNSAIGVGFAALLFGALLTGTSTRNTALTDVFDPNLADNLTLLIQGLVVLFVGADVLVLYFWNARRKLRRGEREAVAT
jgi:general nucleoside transport system permease protein